MFTAALLQYGIRVITGTLMYFHSFARISTLGVVFSSLTFLAQLFRCLALFRCVRKLRRLFCSRTDSPLVPTSTRFRAPAELESSKKLHPRATDEGADRARSPVHQRVLCHVVQSLAVSMRALLALAQFFLTL